MYSLFRIAKTETEYRLDINMFKELRNYQAHSSLVILLRLLFHSDKIQFHRGSVNAIYVTPNQ